MSRRWYHFGRSRKETTVILLVICHRETIHRGGDYVLSLCVSCLRTYKLRHDSDIGLVMVEGSGVEKIRDFCPSTFRPYLDEAVERQ